MAVTGCPRRVDTLGEEPWCTSCCCGIGTMPVMDERLLVFWLGFLIRWEIWTGQMCMYDGCWLIVAKVGLLEKT